MSLFVTLTADLLVAVLLVATIVSTLRLSRRISALKADEAAMRQTISELVVSTASAERAMKGLRAALDECDRTLAERLETGGRLCAELSGHVEAGEGVVTRIGAIVAETRGAQSPREAGQAPREAVVQPLRPTARAAEPMAAPTKSATNGERLNATLAAAQALSERALDRIRARAA